MLDVMADNQDVTTCLAVWHAQNPRRSFRHVQAYILSLHRTSQEQAASSSAGADWESAILKHN